jgi:hypothetical protein
VVVRILDSRRAKAFSLTWRENQLQDVSPVNPAGLFMVVAELVEKTPTVHLAWKYFG